MMKRILILLVALLSFLLIIIPSSYIMAQNVGIGSTAFTPDSKAMLELRGNGYGVLVPRMTWANRPLGLAAAQDGLLIYSTDGDGTNGKGYYYWDGTTLSWKKLFSGATGDYILNQNATDQVANFRITGNGQINTNLYLTSTGSGVVHFGQTGLGGQANGWDPNTLTTNGGIWLENLNSEGGGFYADGEMALIFSPGDIDLLQIWDEDQLPGGTYSAKFDGGGTLYTPMMYDINNTAYYLDPAATSIVNEIGWGNAATRTQTKNDAGGMGGRSGFYETSGPAPATNWPAGATSWWHLLEVRHSNTGNNYAMQFAGSFFDQALYFRKTNNVASQAWSRIMTSSDISGTTNYVAKFTSPSTIGNAQIYDNGTFVGIGTTTSTANSRFQINNTTASAGGRGMSVYISSQSSWPTMDVGVYSSVTRVSDIGQASGLYASAISTTSGSGRNWGVLGYASAGGANVGVKGYVSTTAGENAGILGVLAGYEAFDESTTMAGDWAGFFSGPVKVTGQITSGIAGGTAPFQISSTTMNTNLNADLLDGFHASSFITSTSGFVQNGNSFGTTATLGTNDAFNLGFETSGSTKMTISSDGDVGINTGTSTAYKLYTYESQLTANGDGQATIFGYRTRDSQNDGSSYSMSGTNGAVKGYSYWGDIYSYGVGGFNYNDYTRCGGVLGAYMGGSYWGSLGYKNSGSTTYGAYWTTSGAGAGFMEDNGVITGIGSGGYGGVMGGWVRGEILGLTTAGELYASYNLGNEYTSGISADIVKTADGRKAAYSVTSPEVKVYADGIAQLQNGSYTVVFNSDFASMIDGEGRPTVTVSPIGENNGLYIAELNANGFTVKEREGGTSNAEFTWIAIGKRVDAGNANLPQALKEADFDGQLKGVMFNENNLDKSATPIWWDGTKLRFDKAPEQKLEKKEKE